MKSSVLQFRKRVGWSYVIPFRKFVLEFHWHNSGKVKSIDFNPLCNCVQMLHFLQTLLLVLMCIYYNIFTTPATHMLPTQQACHYLFSGFTFPLAVLVPVWSEVHVAGVRLIDLNPNIGTDSDSENRTQTHRDVVNRYVKSERRPYMLCSHLMVIPKNW